MSQPAPRRSLLVRWLRRAGLLVLALVCARIIIDLVGAIDWAAVRSGVAHLHAWQFGLLFVMVVLRQVLNALPLVFFIDGLSVVRATACDQGSTLMSMVGPPTSDAVFRIVVMRSWGIDVDRATAGSTCNVLAFYMARWIAPLVGVLLLVGVRFDAAYGLSAGAGLLITAAIFVATLMVSRSRRLAMRLGRQAGRVASRVRGSIDPEAWASSVAGFQGHVAHRFRPGLARSLPVLVVMIVVDSLILLLAIRFVGVDQSQLSWLEVMAAFLVVYPLTIFPLQGIGLFDATLVAALTSVGGVELETALVAALVTYRVMTLGTPALLGALFVLGWRRSRRRKAAAPEQS